MTYATQPLATEAPAYGAVDALTASGAVTAVSAEDLGRYLEAPGLVVLFFAGGAKRQRESHDVAVALRELLKDHAGQVRAALVEDDADLKGRYRVVVEPSLVFVLDGTVLEVVPGIRDWADYAAVFRRYLGEPVRGARA